MKKAFALVLALLMLLGLSTTAFAQVLPEAKVSAVTVDGQITAEEWGEPTLHGDRELNWSLNPTGWDYWQSTDHCEGESYDLWLTKDDAFVYLAVRLNNTWGLDTGATGTGDLWQHAALAFTLSAYDPLTTVPRIEYQGQYYEQYNGWQIGLVDNATRKVCSAREQGIGLRPLDDENYAIAYDEATKSYSYELAIPLSKTNIKPETEGIVFSMDLHAAQKPGVTNVTNRYHVSKIAQMTEGGLGAGNFAHTFSNPVIVFPGRELPASEIKTDFAPFSGIPAIDGQVSEAEYGAPVVTVTQDYVSQTWGSFWKYSPDYCSPLQTAKIYMTNDKENIYIAATLDHTGAPDTCDNAADLWKNAHFGVRLSRKDADTTVPRFEFGGDTYEQFTGYMLGIVNGAPVAVDTCQGITPHTPDSYAVSYNAETQTISYELVIPYSRTNIDPVSSREIVATFSIANPASRNNNFNEDAKFGNRLNITTGYATAGGAGNFAMPGNVLPFTLNDVTPETWVDDAVHPISKAPVIDGQVSDEEYGGRALISTTPAHAAASFPDGGYWNFDPSATKPTQNAKFYLTNDDDYVYIAAVVDQSELDTSNNPETYKCASFDFTISRWDEENNVPHIEFQGEQYEQYTGVTMVLRDGVAQANVLPLGINPFTVGEEDFSIVYNAEDQTYTYEIRLPQSMMNFSDAEYVSFSAALCNPYSGADGANRYVLTTGAAFRKSAPNEFPHKGHSMKVHINPLSQVDTWVDTTVPTMENAPKIDGNISEEEWGRPIISSSPDHCLSVFNGYWIFDQSAKKRLQNPKIWLSNDEEYFYVAAEINQCELDESCTAAENLYAAASFEFSLSRYDEDYTVPSVTFEGKEYEQYTRVIMGLVNGVPTVVNRTQGIDIFDIPKEDFAIVYDAEAEAYRYEIRIPTRYTNISGTDIAFSANITQNYTGQGEGANRYNFTTGVAFAGGPGNYSHEDNALRLTLTTAPNPGTGDAFVPSVAVIAAFAAAASVACLIVRRRNLCK